MEEIVVVDYISARNIIATDMEGAAHAATILGHHSSQSQSIHGGFISKKLIQAGNSGA